MKIGNLTVSYDIEKLVKGIHKVEWDLDEFDEGERNDWDLDDMLTFERKRKAFIHQLEKLDETLPTLFEKNITLTKAGKLSKARKNDLIDSGLVNNFEYWEGTNYSWCSWALRVIDDGEGKVKLVLNNSKFSQGT